MVITILYLFLYIDITIITLEVQLLVVHFEKPYSFNLSLLPIHRKFEFICFDNILYVYMFCSGILSSGLSTIIVETWPTL
jgi:hypothetical protein